MRIAIGSDHAGFDLKHYLVFELQNLGYEIIDCGPDTNDPVDYPDFARKVCNLVVSGEVTYGIVVCGTGIGASMAANKIHGIRAALCNTEFSARLTRQHNNANVLALGGRVLGNYQALEITKVFLTEEFSDIDRHKKRIAKMMELENQNN